MDVETFAHPPQQVQTPARGDRVARTREAIVGSALALALAGEVAPIVRDIAKMAGVSARTVFQHFADTAELYVAVLGRVLAAALGDAGAADDVALLRRPRRVVEPHRHRLRHRRTSLGDEALHHAVQAREEGRERGGLRSGEADRVLHRSGDAREVRAVREARRRVVAGGVRSGGLPERDQARRTRRRTIRIGAWKTRATRSSAGRRRTARSRRCSHDPRSGEIISADVRAFPNVQTFGASWYLVQAGPLDKRAQQLPLPDDVIGRTDPQPRRAPGRPHARPACTT